MQVIYRVLRHPATLCIEIIFLNATKLGAKKKCKIVSIKLIYNQHIIMQKPFVLHSDT